MIITCGPKDNERQIELVIPKDKKLYLMLSSGADSAILLYLICLELLRENRSPDQEIKHIFTLPKVDGAEDHAEKIVLWINNKLNISLPMPTIDSPPNINEMYHGDILYKSLRYLTNKYDLNFGFLGDQQPVPEPYKVGGVYPVRYFPNPFPDQFGLPFEPLDKSHTIDLHFRFDTKELLVLSHSCTQLRQGRCNNCYHCFERKWAFDRLGYADPGEN